MTTRARPLRAIAQDIVADWPRAPAQARGYLNAMLTLNRVDDRYFFETGRELVQHFLSSAGQWRGPVAQQLRFELHTLLTPTAPDVAERQTTGVQ